jgi:hypothetical protein
MPALELAGDAELVLARLDERERIGTGAERQRALWAKARSREAFVSALAQVTASSRGTADPASLTPATRS